MKISHYFALQDKESVTLASMVEKAYPNGVSLVVTNNATESEELSHFLWIHASQKFLPHVIYDDPNFAQYIDEIPIIIADLASLTKLKRTEYEFLFFFKPNIYPITTSDITCVQRSTYVHGGVQHDKEYFEENKHISLFIQDGNGKWISSSTIL